MNPSLRMDRPRLAAILTALRVEYLAVRAHLTAIVEIVHVSGTVYERGSLALEGEAWDVVLAEVGTGNPEAGIHAERIIAEFRPSVVFFVGVAGGLKDVALGDVVVATKVYAYESGKQGATFELRPLVANSSHAVEQRARAEARKDDWRTAIMGARTDPPPRVFVGAIAAGEKVVAGNRSELVNFLRTNYGDALAVAMEDYGILRAANIRGIDALVIRGISDLLTDKASSDAAGSQERAARHASAFALQVLARLRLDRRAPAPRECATPRVPARLVRDDRALLRRFLDWWSAHLVLLWMRLTGARVDDDYDLYLSHAPHHAAAVERLREVLASAKIRVWRPTSSARQFTALGHCRVLAVYASEDWPDSEACVAEFVAASAAAVRLGGTSLPRILAIRPHGTGALDAATFGPLANTLTIELSEAPSRRSPGVRTLVMHLRRLARIDRRCFRDAGPLTATSCWHVHPHTGSPRFVGRANELWRVHTALAGTGEPCDRPVVVQIRGLAGIGKTLLAIEYAARFSRHWPGGIFWIDASATRPSAQQPAQRRIALLADLAPALGVTSDGDNLHTVAHNVEREIVTRTAGQRFLWIVDNLPHDLDHQGAQSMLPPGLAGATLLTTRNKALESLGPCLDLTALAPAAALALLTTRSPPDDDSERAAAQDIAKTVEQHPLGLDVLGALVATTRLTSPTPYAVWRARLLAPGEDVLDTQAGTPADDLPTSCTKSVSRAIAGSLEHVRSSLARNIVRLASLLAPGPIPGALLVAVAPILADPGMDALLAVEHALDELAAHSLLTGTADGPGIHVHSLVRRVVAAIPWDPELQARAREALQVALARALDVDVRDPGTHGPLLTLLPHARLLADGESLAGGRLAVRVSDLVSTRGEYADAEALCSSGAQVLKRDLGSEHPETLSARHLLAEIQKNRCNLPAARAGFVEVLAARERTLGEEHPDTLTTRHKLAATHQDLGNIAGATEEFEKLLAVRLRTLGAEHPDTLRTEHNLALIRMQRGDMSQLQELERIHTIQLRILGAEHPDTLSTLESQAITHHRMRNHQTARNLYEVISSIEERVLGADHPSTLMTVTNLAGELHAQGDNTGSQAIFERVLAAFTREHGPDHPQLAPILHNLGIVCWARQDLPGVRSFYERAYALEERHLGLDHPSTLRTMRSMARLALAERRLTDASELCERAFTGLERHLGPEAADTLDCLRVRAEIFDIEQNYTAAFETRRRIWETQRRILGPESLVTLETQRSMAIAWIALGQHETARESLRQVLEAQRRLLGPEHHDTLETLRQIGLNLEVSKDLAGAQEVFEQLLALQERSLGPEHVDTLQTADNLGQTLVERGSFAAARALYETTIVRRKRVLGEEHRLTLVSGANLAFAIRSQGDFRTSREHLNRIVAVQERVLGAADRETIRTRSVLACTLDVLGDAGEARKQHELALATALDAYGEYHEITHTSRANLIGFLARHEPGATVHHLEVLRELQRRTALSPTEAKIRDSIPQIERMIASSQRPRFFSTSFDKFVLPKREPTDL